MHEGCRDNKKIARKLLLSVLYSFFSLFEDVHKEVEDIRFADSGLDILLLQRSPLVLLRIAPRPAVMMVMMTMAKTVPKTKHVHVENGVSDFSAGTKSYRPFSQPIAPPVCASNMEVVNRKRLMFDLLLCQQPNASQGIGFDCCGSLDVSLCAGLRPKRNSHLRFD